MADLSIPTIKESVLPNAPDENVTHIRVVSTNNSEKLPKGDLTVNGAKVPISVAGVTATNAQAAIAELKANEDTLGTEKAPAANPIFTGNVVIPDADAANEAVSKGQMDAADQADYAKSVEMIAHDATAPSPIIPTGTTKTYEFSTGGSCTWLDNQVVEKGDKVTVAFTAPSTFVRTLVSLASLKVDKTAIKQVTGTSETDVMSQKAVTVEFLKTTANASTFSIVDEEVVDNYASVQLFKTFIKAAYLETTNQTSTPILATDKYRIYYFSFKTYYANGINIMLQRKRSGDIDWTVLEFTKAVDWVNGLRTTLLNGDLRLTVILTDNNLATVANTGAKGIYLSSSSYIGSYPEQINTAMAALDAKINSNYTALDNQLLDGESVVEQSEQLFDVSKSTVGIVINSNGSTSPIETSPESWRTSDFTKYYDAANITLSLLQGATVPYSVAFYNSSKVFIPGSYQLLWGTQFNGVLTPPAGGVYVRFTVQSNMHWMLCAGTEKKAYVEYSHFEYKKFNADKLGTECRFKPDVTDENLLELLGNTSGITPLLPSSIYTVCNDNYDNAETVRNYSVNLFLDHLLKLTSYKKLRFLETGNDKLPFYSKYNSFTHVFNEDGSIVKTVSKKFHIEGQAEGVEYGINHVSTLNSATKNKMPIVLCIGDSTVQGLHASSNRPYSDSPTTFWTWAQSLFAFDQLDINDPTKYKSLFVGRVVANCNAKYDKYGDFVEPQTVAIRACSEGRNSAYLSEFLRSATVGGVENPFYDSSAVTTNKFRIAKWIEKYRTMDDAGVRLYGVAGGQAYYDAGLTQIATGYTIGTNVTDTTAYDICKPTHVFIQLGYNDGDRAGYTDDMTALMTQIQSEIEGCYCCFSLPDCPGTYFNELYPEYGHDENDSYPISFLYGASKTAHDTFYSMNQKLIAIEDVPSKQYYLPTYFVTPTAQSAAYRESNNVSFLSSGLEKDRLRIMTGAAPQLHPNNYAHAVWGYQLYAWIKYTLTL